ncbi:MAG: DUF4870 domain-containing protein [Burkholderiales bacterium]|jgi:uncharacterized Tic20 family protein|nr:DUF4870 domain-containing protein [Burkholderiales bacterium]
MTEEVINAEIVNTPEPIGNDDKNLAMLAHLLSIVTSFVGALVIWLIHKERTDKSYVNAQAKEALNFQILVMIAWIIALSFNVFPLIGSLIFMIFGFIIFWANLIFCIVAAISASQGKPFRYPLSPHLIK